MQGGGEGGERHRASLSATLACGIRCADPARGSKSCVFVRDVVVGSPRHDFRDLGWPSGTVL